MAARLLAFWFIVFSVSLLSPAYAQTISPSVVSQVSPASPSAAENAKNIVILRLKGHIDNEERITERLYKYIQHLRENGSDVGQLEKEYTVLASAALDIDKAYSIVQAGTDPAAIKQQVPADFKEKVRQTVRYLQAALNSQKRLIQLIKALSSVSPTAAATSAGE